MTGSAPAHRGRRDNGLDSEHFSPVADLDPRLADHVLDVLGLREVPAYVEPIATNSTAAADRLFVASTMTDQATALLGEVAAELGVEVSSGAAQDPRGNSPDLLAGLDTDSEFAAIIADLADLDRPLFNPSTSPQTATARERDDEVEHFVPPPPPPIPRPAAATILAIVLTLVGVVVLAFGSAIGLGSDMPLPLGVVLVLFGTGMLIMRLRPEPRDDSDDDGAVI